MKLYYSQYTRSGRARWMLEECGASYEIERISVMKGEGQKPEYLALHPHGQVPTLVDDGCAIFESSAILMHLADKFPEKKLAPALGSDDRAHYYRWMVYLPATVDPALEAITFHTKLLPEDKRVPAIAADGQRKVAKAGKILEEAVSGRAYVVGDSFTAADVALASVAGWFAFIGLLGDYPKLAEYHKRMSARPAYAKAYAD